MVLSINPSIPIIAAPSVGTVTDALDLPQGSVVTAQVQALLANDLARILIGNLALEVASEVPLQVGQTLQLAMAQSEQGVVRLAIVGQGQAADSSAPTDQVADAPPVVVDTPNARAATASPTDPLTPLERIAVSVATEQAVTKQGSQGQLFADLTAAVSSPDLPPALRAAVTQVLAQQTPLDQTLTGGDIRRALQSSGLVLESSLASGPASPTPASDLKAALIVLRQTLSAVLQTTEAASSSPSAPPNASPGFATYSAPLGTNVPQRPSPSVVPSSSPMRDDVDAQPSSSSMATPQGRSSPLASTLFSGPAGAGLAEALARAAPRSLTPNAILTMLQQADRQPSRMTDLAAPTRVSTADGQSEEVVVRTNLPSPPFRGSLPTAQAVALPAQLADAPLSKIAHRLLDDTDAALSRQTLLQIASLPERPDAPGARNDPAMARWNFEIPFATPQGTAMAQFEISRDANAGPPDAAKRVWRARFSLDVEPAGPVHALVSLSGERTSVRMWAERPGTARQLRAGTRDLSRALSQAELTPGDIVVQEGAPPAVASPKAGHFLDRAL